MACCSNNDNSTSACALRRILRNLDCLSEQDLRALRDVIDRILDRDCDC
jgi:two-component SAPR family response regulator